MRPSLNPLEDVFSHLSDQLASVQSNHARLLGGKTVSEVMREIDVLRGHKRALDFGLPLLDHELTTLTSRLESSRSEIPKLQRELSSLQSERSSLLKTVEEMKSQLRSLNDRLSTTYPTSDELSALEDRNQSLQKQVADLQHSADQLKSELADIKGAGGVEQAKWDLVSRKKKLVAALQSLASSQQSVSEWWMAQLSFAIDREEKIQKLRSLERELFLIRGDESQLFSIPEHVPVRTLDFEGEDIQARQEDLANLEKALKEADWVHRGLLLRISELERDLS
jgi:chromosome segregation ATPase